VYWKFFIAFALCLSISIASSAQKYVSSSGSDSNPGTISLPYATITKAISVSTAGDTIYVRGGTYTLTTTINISKSGTSTSKYHLFAYQNERPILDFSGMAVSSSNRGISLSGSYWYIKGLDVKGAGDNGLNVSGSNNIIEFCSFYENRDSGCQLGGGAANNQVINCDSYYNCDPGQGNADGFSPKLDVGTGNYFYGCRSWQNSDDGYDGYLRPSDDITTTYVNCWAFKNGYLKSGVAGSGNGNGFKMGGSDAKDLRHNAVLKDCLSFDNLVKGFDQNNNKGSMTLYNCTAYNNGTNYKIDLALASGETLTVKNCVALGDYGSLGSWAVQQTNSWLSPFSVSAGDFISIDSSPAYGPRNADGSLPNISYMRLATGSDLIDAGTNVGLPYYGSAPDLGAFESGGPAVPTYTLTISSTNGSVSRNPNLSAYDSNSTVVLTALPSTGYHLVSWSGDASGSTNPLSMVMNGNKSITANFALNTYTLTVTATNGTVTKNPSQSAYDTNTTVQLTAVPSIGYHFVSWSGDASGSTNPLSVTMNSNKSITANFAINTYTLNITAVNGTVTKNPSQSAYDSNTTVQLTAVPATGYRFVSWSGDASGSSNPVSMLMNANKNVTANFAATGCILNITAANGSVSKNPDLAVYDSNATVQLTASPASGYHFVNWTGDTSSSANPLFVIMNGSKSITANFAINAFTVTVNAANGTVIKNPNQSVYDSNSTVQLTALPATGYHFTGWSGSTSGSANPLSLLVDGNKNVTANFAINTYSLSITATNGAVLKNPSQSAYDSNTTVQLTAFPASGYHFVNWTGDVTGSSNPISVIMNGNKSVTAVFALTVVSNFTLNITSLNGTVTRVPDQSSYDSSSTVQLTAVPASGYHFVNWSGDISGSSNPVDVVMDGNKNITANYAVNPITQFSLNVNASHGIVTKSPDQSLYDSNTTVHLTAVPSSGYRFTGWDGDMSGSGNPDSIILNANKSVTASFTLDIPVPTDHEFIADANWNMVSFPYTVSDYSAHTLFPTASSMAISFDHGYVSQDSLIPMVGYWMKFAAKETLTITGSDRLKDSLLLKKGWNMVGSISRPISVSNIHENVAGLIETPFYGYEGSYLSADTIYPGKSYWVKASQVGQITIDTISLAAKQSTSWIDVTNGMNSITITDRNGNQGKLYFGSQENSLYVSSLFEMPPPGPAGSFDVRFSSDRCAEVYPSGIVKTQNYPILISATAYPLSVSWNIQNSGSYQYTLSAPNGINQKLAGTGSMALARPTQTMLLGVGSRGTLPTEFSLSENYPNPFNPSTRLILAVPATAHVDAAIYDLLGRKVRILINSDVEAGYQTLEWNGSSENNLPVAGGMYFLRVTSGKYSEVRKLLLMK
jgi:hypothetical protein